jgi:Flp pilus assembly CpaF family ATPase
MGELNAVLSTQSAILPFLQPIANLITDPGVSEVMVNGDGAIFIQCDSCVHSSG